MPSRRLWLLMGLFVIAFGVDGVNSYLHLFPGLPSLYEPQHWSRLVTGTGMGLAIALVLYPVYQQTVWNGWVNEPAIRSSRSFLGLIAAGALLDVIVFTENPLALYPLSLVSAAGVLLILTMVYSLVWIMVFRRENGFERLQQMTLPLVGGFGVTILQIAALNFLRFYFTGTWGGFEIG
jgi:hypothetical protein